MLLMQIVQTFHVLTDMPAYISEIEQFTRLEVTETAQSQQQRLLQMLFLNQK